ncbi:hypothetical protein ACJZ2D_014661 [Fusarium nematophilum]
MASGQSSQGPCRLFIHMSGAPGSGKSMMARLLRQSIGGLVIDHDVFRSALLEYNDVAFDEVAKRAYNLQWLLAEDAMKQGLNIIIDSTCNFQEVLDQGSALAEKYDFTYWYVECKVEDIDLLDNRLRSRDSIKKSQRTGVDCPPAAACHARAGEDSRALFKNWIENPCRPKHNAIVVDSMGNLEIHRDHILKQVVGQPRLERVASFIPPDPEPQPEMTVDQPVTTEEPGMPDETRDAPQGPTQPGDTAPATDPADAPVAENPETVITGAGDAVVTYSPTQDPAYSYSTLTQTVATTDDDTNMIIFPSGRRWSLAGAPPINLPPPPNRNPDPNPKDPDEDPDDSPDEEEEEGEEEEEEEDSTSTTTEPGTELGDCPPVPGCVSGEQSTTATTIPTSIPWAVEARPPKGGAIPDPREAGEDTLDEYERMFKKMGIGLSTDDNPGAKCSNDRFGAGSSRFTNLVGKFCLEAAKDEKQQFTMKLTGDDISSSG